MALEGCTSEAHCAASGRALVIGGCSPALSKGGNQTLPLGYLGGGIQGSNQQCSYEFVRLPSLQCTTSERVSEVLAE